MRRLFTPMVLWQLVIAVAGWDDKLLHNSFNDNSHRRLSKKKSAHVTELISGEVSS
jgi:hypothetical protein